MSMDDDDEDDANFKAGTEISTSKAIYTVVRLLGEGGFGAVYLVKSNKGLQCAMKVEKKMEKRKHSKLKMEIAILKLITEGKHFTKILDRGKKETDGGFFFLVMELVGKSLGDLKSERADKVFSFGTGLGVSMQCLEAVEELHKHGFIHRDLKPANYACGLDDKKHLIYILDFGIARKYINAKKELKTPRETVGFKGTVRFASLACHYNTEMAPKDDCESWFYLLLDLIIVGGLPWRKLNEKDDVRKCKEECRKDRKSTFFLGIKHSNELSKILDYIDSIAYQDRVDYKFIYRHLSEACTAAGLDIDAPYDWENSKDKDTSKESTRSK
uniref:Protein kinase domain-containing protein n=1 Tax=Caenorhabditis tropicalis TaxID=1561998 RepID=A0A1I7UUK0_9PELO